MQTGDLEGDRGVLLAKLYGARSAAAELGRRVTSLEAALRTALECWEHRVAADTEPGNYIAAEKELVAECRDVLDGGRAFVAKEEQASLKPHSEQDLPIAEKAKPDWWGKCKCWRPGWFEGHDDPKCEFRDG